MSQHVTQVTLKPHFTLLLYFIQYKVPWSICFVRYNVHLSKHVHMVLTFQKDMFDFLISKLYNCTIMNF